MSILEKRGRGLGIEVEGEEARIYSMQRIDYLGMAAI